MRINKFEDYILKKTEKYGDIIFLSVILFLAIIIRWKGLEFRSDDYNRYLEPWFYEVKGYNGFESLKYQVGDYNIPYQTVILLISKIPNVNALYAYKEFSILFDVILSIVAMMFYVKIIKKRNKINYKSFYVFAIYLLIPTNILNSAWWGQCDSIYSTFILISLYFLMSEKIKSSLFFYGIAFALKLQSVFILPFYILYYIKMKKYTILNIIYLIAGIYILCIPALIMGRDKLDPIRIYFSQVSEYPSMSMNFPSFWNLLTNDYITWGNFAVIMTASVLMLEMFFVYKCEKYNFDNIQYVIHIVIWFMWSAIIFLPSMHERYSYVLTAFLILATFIDLRYLKYSLAEESVTLIMYSNYLMNLDNRISIIETSIVYFVMFSLFSIETVSILSGKSFLSKEHYSTNEFL